MLTCLYWKLHCYSYIAIRVYICVYICTCVCNYVCVCVCMHECVCSYACVCLCVCVCVYVCVLRVDTQNRQCIAHTCTQTLRHMPTLQTKAVS